ncbi:EamA family transporter [Escherichia coli]|nr:EamA family transporter [Escherichia coli]EHR9097776.1 EamA family transporter [Escherichia coli]EIM2935363.1 EamA family transporter [Escherichia coli]EIM2940976.1 EamA family transporter [Escherichia coli]
MLKNILIIIIMATIWGTSFPISKPAISEVGPYAFRLSCSIIAIIFIFLFFSKDILSEIKNITYQNTWRLFLISVPNIFAVPVLNNIALKYTSVSYASILIYTMPCFTSLFMMFIFKKIKALSLIAILLCASGIYLITNNIKIDFGITIIIISAIIWSFGAILSQNIVINLGFGTKLFWMSFISTILVIITYPFFQEEQQIHLILCAFTNTSVLFSVIYIGFFGGAVVYYIWFYLIQYKSAEYASYSTLLSPIISVAIAYFFMDEELNSFQFTGFFLILSSAVIINIAIPIIEKEKTNNIINDNSHRKSF